MRDLSKYVYTENTSIYPYELNRIEKAEVDMGIKFPKELRAFYEKYGYGFLNDMNHRASNRLLSPLQCADVRLRRDYYKYDPDLESYITEEKVYNRLIFFEVNEGSYLTIDINDNEKSAIYYVEEKIADSLEEFIMKMYDDGCYYW